MTSGALPSGLTFNASTGAISGTPLAGGTTTLTFQLTDSDTPAQSATATVVLVCTNLPLTITTTVLNNGVVGLPYSQTLTATGGTGPHTWRVIAGRLPSWATLDPTTGVLSGTPTGEMSGSILSFQVTDSGNPPQTATASFSLTIGSTL
jgi:hypothetical protein